MFGVVEYGGRVEGDGSLVEGSGSTSRVTACNE